MAVARTILTVILLIVSLILVVIVLMQEGKSAGLSGSISGAAETFWGKNKGRSIEGKLEKSTKYFAAAFIILSVVLNILY